MKDVLSALSTTTTATTAAAWRPYRIWQCDGIERCRQHPLRLRRFSVRLVSPWPQKNKAGGELLTMIRWSAGDGGSPDDIGSLLKAPPTSAIRTDERSGLDGIEFRSVEVDPDVPAAGWTRDVARGGGGGATGLWNNMFFNSLKLKLSWSLKGFINSTREPKHWTNRNLKCSWTFFTSVVLFALQPSVNRPLIW